MAQIRLIDFLNPSPTSTNDKAFFPLLTNTNELLIPGPSDYLLNDYTCYNPDNTIATDPNVAANCPLFDGVTSIATLYKYKVKIFNN